MNQEDQLDAFSDDPEENLRIENQLLRLQLRAETGAEFLDVSQLEPEEEHQFLLHMLKMERQMDNVPEVRIVSLFEPGELPMPAAELDEAMLEEAVEAFTKTLKKKFIEVEFGAFYSPLVRYKFLTEELMELSIQLFDIPGLMHNFCYEEYHPNHELSVKLLAGDFIENWLARNEEAYSFLLAEVLTGRDGATYSREEVRQRISLIFDAYSAFSSCAYFITLIQIQEEEEEPETAVVEATIKYEAFLHNDDRQWVQEKVVIWFARIPDTDFWEIIGFNMPGIEI